MAATTRNPSPSSKSSKNTKSKMTTPKKFSPRQRRNLDKRPTYNENQVSLIIPGIHDGVKVDWSKGTRRTRRGASKSLVAKIESAVKNGSPDKKSHTKTVDQPEINTVKTKKKRDAITSKAITPDSTFVKKITEKKAGKRKSTDNSVTNNDDVVGVAKKPKSVTKENNSKITNEQSKKNPAKKSPPNKKASKITKTANAKKGKKKITPRDPHIRRTACLNADAILTAMYEPMPPKPNTSSSTELYTVKNDNIKDKRNSVEVQKTKPIRKSTTPKVKRQVNVHSNTDIIDLSHSDNECNNDNNKIVVPIKINKDNKTNNKDDINHNKNVDLKKKKQLTNADVKKKPQKNLKRKETTNDDGPTAKRMASLNASAFLEAAYREEPGDIVEKKQKKKKVKEMINNEKQINTSCTVSLNTSCTAVMVVSTRPSASVQPRQQAPQPIMPFVPNVPHTTNRLQRPIHAFSFAPTTHHFSNVGAPQSNEIRPTFSLYNLPIHPSAPVYDQMAANCQPMRQRYFIQQQQQQQHSQCWQQQTFPLIRPDFKTMTTMACAFRPIAPQRHMISPNMGGLQTQTQQLLISNLLPGQQAIPFPIQSNPNTISPVKQVIQISKSPSPADYNKTPSSSGSKQSSKSSSGGSKSGKGSGKRNSDKNQIAYSDTLTPKRRPVDESNVSKKQFKWEWIGDPCMKMIPSHTNPLPIKSNNGGSITASPNTPQNSPIQLVKRKCYQAIKHKDGDIVKIRDCILVKGSKRKTSAPYVAKVAALWEDENNKEMMMSILWYYRPEQTEANHIPHHHPAEVFASRHADVVNVQTIDDVCQVLTKSQFCRYRKEQEMVKNCIPRSIPYVPLSDIITAKMPCVDASPDTVFLCYRVYDVRGKRILKHPPRVTFDDNSYSTMSSSSSDEKQ